MTKNLDISGKKKKVKKTTTSLAKSKAVAEVAPPKRHTKLKSPTSLNTILGDSVAEINSLLESNASDSAHTLMQKRLLQTLMDMLTLAERNIRESGGVKGIYAFNSLVTSVREIMIDVQATKDKGAIGDSMVERVIRPAFLDIGKDLLLESELFLKEIKDELGTAEYKKVREAQTASLHRLARAIQDKYADVKTQAITFLQQ